MQIEMVQQLIPTVRFDGYFVLADLAGVPDLLARVRPVLLSLLPGRPADPRVTELRPSDTRASSPGGCSLSYRPWRSASAGCSTAFPTFCTAQRRRITAQAEAIAESWDADQYAAVILGAVSIVLLHASRRRAVAIGLELGEARPPPPRPPSCHAARAVEQCGPENHITCHAAPTGVDMTSDTRRDAEYGSSGESKAAPEPPPEPALTSGLINGRCVRRTRAMLGSKNGPAPAHGWRRAVYGATSGAINPGPSSAERNRAAVLERVTAPIGRITTRRRRESQGRRRQNDDHARAGQYLRDDAGRPASSPWTRTPMPAISRIELLGRVHARSPMSSTRWNSLPATPDLRRFTAQAPDSRLEVLASDDDPRIGLALNRQAYHRVIELLDHYYNLIVIDTGTESWTARTRDCWPTPISSSWSSSSALDGARAAALTWTGSPSMAMASWWPARSS